MQNLSVYSSNLRHIILVPVIRNNVIQCRWYSIVLKFSPIGNLKIRLYPCMQNGKIIDDAIVDDENDMVSFNLGPFTAKHDHSHLFIVFFSHLGCWYWELNKCLYIFKFANNVKVNKYE